MFKPIRFILAGLALVGAQSVLGEYQRAAAWTELKVADDAPTLSVERGRSSVVEVDQPFATIAIADPEIADVTATSNRSFFVRGRSPGVTTVLIYNELGTIQELIQISVSISLDALRHDLKVLLPQEELNVYPVSDGIFVKGSVSSADAAATAMDLAERYVPNGVANGLTVDQSQQVLLEVRFVEVSRDISKDFAVGASIAQAGDFAFATNGDLLSGLAQAAAIFSGISLGGAATLDVTLEALESKGVARTLARPNLVALSGDTASFLAGGEFPIPVAQEGDQISIEFREFGVSLAFTPTVLADDVINLKVAPEVSTIDTTSAVSTAGVSVPGLSVRRAETTIELRDGQAFAVAGLLQNEYANDVAKTPWAGDIPILGALFSSKRYLRSETELVIIIVPRLVQPAASVEAIHTPFDTLAEPSEAEFFLLDETIAVHETLAK